MQPLTKKVFTSAFITLLVDLLAFTQILPLLPKTLDYYAQFDTSNTYALFDNKIQAIRNLSNSSTVQNNVLLAGLLGSWFSLLQFLSSPIVGSLSDRYGRKPILILTMSGTLMSYVAWLLATENFGLFILSRTIGGLSKANIGLILAIISDVSDQESRGKGMAIVGASFSLGFIFGPLMGAFLATLASNQESMQLIVIPSCISIGLALINLVFVTTCFKETYHATETSAITQNKNDLRRRKKSQNFRPVDFINPKSLLGFELVKRTTQAQKQLLTKLGTIYFVYMLFYSGLEFTLSFLTHIRFGFTPMQQGKLYFFSGSLMAIIQGGYIRRIKGGKEARIATVGLSLIIPSFFLMGLSNSVAQVYFALGLYALSSSVVVPCLTTLVSSQSHADQHGATMGTLRSLGALARAIGPCLASAIFWTFGPAICYMVGAMALIIPVYMMRSLKVDEKAALEEKKSDPKSTSLPVRPARAN